MILFGCISDIRALSLAATAIRDICGAKRPDDHICLEEPQIKSSCRTKMAIEPVRKADNLNNVVLDVVLDSIYRLVQKNALF